MSEIQNPPNYLTIEQRIALTAQFEASPSVVKWGCFQSLQAHALAVDYELERLQAIERRWLAMCEHGWRVKTNIWSMVLGNSVVYSHDGTEVASGPTPEAAVDAAIERLKGGGA